jgi:uncharacterized protein (TIGR00251 family)
MKDSKMIRTDIKVRLLPRSSRNQVVGRRGDEIRVKVTAPPVDGKANKALIDCLARELAIPKQSLEIVSGKKAKLKTVRIYNKSPKQVLPLLEG